MIKYYESVFYNTLEELNATYKHNHPDVLRLKNNTGMVFSLAERWKIIMTKMEAVEENIIKSTKEKDNVEKGVN